MPAPYRPTSLAPSPVVFPGTSTGAPRATSRAVVPWRGLAGAALLSGAALGTGTAAAETWDMPLAYAATNFHSENAARFGECVGEATGGDVDIVTHPAGALFKGADIKRAVQTGQAPIGERLLSAHQNEDAIFGFDSVPFLATSFDDSGALYAAAKPVIERVLDEQGLVLLYAVPWPPQGLYFAKAVGSVADMQGVKFRSYNNTTARFAELTGMLPVTVEAAELSQALATGVAESMISSGATGYDQKVWEQLTHFYPVDAWLPRNYVFANKAMFEDLDEGARQALVDCGAEAGTRGEAAAREYTDFTVAGLKEAGMTVEDARPELVEELQGIGETMTSEWLDTAGSDGRAIVDAYTSR